MPFITFMRNHLLLPSFTVIYSCPYGEIISRCHNILFVRSDGSVRLGGYAWMCRAMDTVNYDFPGRARKDSDLVVG